MQSLKIVITGGPSTGKSSLLKALSRYKVPCFEEISRQVTLEARQHGVSQLFVEDPLHFSQKLLDARIKQYEASLVVENPFVFFDRGIPDVKAYLNFAKTPHPDFFHQAALDLRYDCVFILPLWEEIYTTDSERYESFSQALEIQWHLQSYYNTLGYEPIEVPIGIVEERIAFIKHKLEAAFQLSPF
ncbi:MAG: ATP-binding protein [Bacteroidetes bacterium]|nr:ATP-binding protein [Bacteroidota bacterium]